MSVRRFVSCFAASALTFLYALPSFAADPRTEFFEKKIRPVLVEQCYSCHSEQALKNKKLRGGLFLDTAAGIRTGGDSGPALVASKPSESLLLKSIKQEDDLKMPPKGKLSPEVIADFEKWIRDGAFDPRTGTTKKLAGLDLTAGRQFWSYQPITKPAVPAVADAESHPNPIDRFILAKLEERKIPASPAADRVTLIRRLYVDLIGLPPTPEQIDAFVTDSSPKAYEKLVDKLLASPAFGERWARHWFDISRYADSVTLRGLVFKEAWRYRDYVIDSFNRDLPFDRFVTEQLAGDLLPAADRDQRTRQLVATSYLAMGNTNLEEQDKKQLRMDVVDEQLDVIGKGLLAQTLTCARCHDHKFDPIPTRDYYALAGILRNAKAMEHANVSKWVEVPLPVDPATESLLAKHDAEVKSLQDRIKQAKAKQTGTKTVSAKGVMPVKDVPGIVVDDAGSMKVGDWKASTFSGTFIGSGYIHDDNSRKGEKTLTFQPQLPSTGKYEVWLAYSSGGGRAENVPVTVFSAEGEKALHIDMKVAPPIDGRFVSLGQYRFEKDGQSFVIVSNEGTKGHVTADAVTFIPVDQLKNADKPGTKAAGKAGDKAADKGEPVLAQMEADLKKLQANAPKRPMTMSVQEEAKIEDCKVHIRGVVSNLGDTVPRGFLQVTQRADQRHQSLPEKQSGRLELAKWVASPENPLTARVWANRVWFWLLGNGIVPTLDNFGTTGDLPSHPALLDHLASQFIEKGWSTKALVRQIVLSQTYQQASNVPEKQVQADLENRYFSRANRRRIEAEVLRDTLLTVSGQLNPAHDGPLFPASLSADIGFAQTSLNRSVYLPVFRNSLPEIFEAFDFADPSMVVGKRNTSTVAPQALFLMNNPFVLEQSQKTTERLLKMASTDAERIDLLYRMAMARLPQSGEREVALQFLSKRGKTAWPLLVQTVFATADFRYLD